MNSKAKRDAANVFDSYLTKDETILWMGKPNPVSLFSLADLFLIPFSLLWGGFAIFWEGAALSSRAPDLLFSLWGIPFVLMGQYFIWGRFVHKYLRRKSTYYALTEKRALILNTFFGKSFKAYFLHQMSSLDHQRNSILFGDGNAAVYSQIRRADWSGESQPGFYSIPDTDEVYRLMQALILPEKSKVA
jgi:hypothetical protein